MQKVFAFLALLVIVFAIPRGFDISDEGLYVLLADPHQANEGGVLNYDLFFKFIYQFTGVEFGIQGLRFLRLSSYFLGALSLTFFWKNIQHSKQLSFSIFLVALTSLFGGYAFLPPSLSYNSISVVGAAIWLGIVAKDKLSLRDWLLLGLVFSVLIYSKVTVGLLLGFLTVIYFGFRGELDIKGVLGMIFPILILEGLFFMLFQENAWSRLTGAYGFMWQREDYGVLLLVKYTAVGLFWTLLAGLIFFVLGKLRPLSKPAFLTIFVLGITALLLVFQLTRITSEWNHLFLLITFALIAWQLGLRGILTFQTKQEQAFWLLIALPFLLHFGSNVYWMRLGIHYWVFWVLALIHLLQDTSPQFTPKLNVIVSLCSVILVFFGLWVNPFEGDALWKSRSEWHYKSGKKILLSENQVNSLNAIHAEIKDSDKDKTVTLFRNPGILYLFGINSPFSPAYWKTSQAQLFLKNGDSLDFILYNGLEIFPFDRSSWVLKKELIQPNGENLEVLWRK